MLAMQVQELEQENMQLKEQIEHAVIAEDIRTHEMVLAAPAGLPLVDAARLRPVDHIGGGVDNKRMVAYNLADIEIIDALIVEHIRVCAVSPA